MVTSYQVMQPIYCVQTMKLSTVDYQLWYSSAMKKYVMTLKVSNVLCGKFYIKIKKINLQSQKTFYLRTLCARKCDIVHVGMLEGLKSNSLHRKSLYP
jgi:hypothetical protein